MTCRAVAHLAKARCGQIDGVRTASATATTRRVHLNVTTFLHEPGDLRARITDAVRARLEETGLSPGSGGYRDGPVERLGPFAHPPATATI